MKTKSIFGLIVLFLALTIPTQSHAQGWSVVSVSWDEPTSPTTGNKLIATNFHFYAAIGQFSVLFGEVEYWSGSVYTSTDYSPDINIWNLSFPFQQNKSYQLFTICPTFLAIDPVTAEMWHVSSQVSASGNWLPMFIDGSLSWDYWPVQ